ncbi:immunoglobulin iota chain-like [Equus caballus]|uniref:immunoglobulin iota chain-like n=1 Tax=Equus caballus TaxID=9796 RepID=UPI0038B2CFB9
MVVAGSGGVMAPPLGGWRRMLAQPLEGPRSPGSVGSARQSTAVCTMSWAPVLLVLLAHRAGCGPQPVLNQPPSVSSSLGSTVRLACTLSSDHDVSLYSIYWYQQRPGHPPRFLLRYFSHSDKSQGPRIPPRFSGSKDLAKNTGYLSISELQPEDEAVYFCAVGAQGWERERERGAEKEPAAPGPQAPQDTLSLN